MQFALTEEQEAIVATTRSFVERELIPHEEKVEKLGQVPKELEEEIKKKSIDAGIYACNMPTEYGGGGLDSFDTTLVDSEFGQRHTRCITSLLARPTSCGPARKVRSRNTSSPPLRVTVSTAWQ